MNWKKWVGFILCFAVLLPFGFFVLCTALAIVDPEGRIALAVFIPMDLFFVGLFLLGIRLIRSGNDEHERDTAAFTQNGRHTGNAKKWIGFILILVLIPVLIFFVICTIFAIADPERWSALAVFIPLVLMLAGLLILSIRMIRSGKKVKEDKYRPAPPSAAAENTIRCPECGGRNPADQRTCELCGSRLR